MERFFDIHVKYDGSESSPGYSVFVEAKDETEALKKCIDNNMFAEDGDEDYIDNITEISEEGYNYAINA